MAILAKMAYLAKMAEIAINRKNRQTTIQIRWQRGPLESGPWESGDFGENGVFGENSRIGV